MSVQSQIDRLNAIKQRIRTNLVAQGITVPDDTKLEAMAEQILSVAGEDGYTPVRGADYWTDADKTEIVEEVKNSGVVMYAEQTLTEEQKAQARQNIGALSSESLTYVEPQKVAFTISKSGVNTSNGSMGSSSSYYRTDYTNLSGYDTIEFHGVCGEDKYSIAFYDSNKTLMADVSVAGTGTSVITHTMPIPNGAVYAIGSAYMGSSVDANEEKYYMLVSSSTSNPLAEAVLCVEQTFTEEQKAQARENIGAVNADEIEDLIIYKEDMAFVPTITGHVNTDLYFSTASSTKRTDYLPLYGYHKITFTTKISASGYAVLFFDENKTAMPGVSVVGTNSTQTVDMEIPDGAAYAICCMYNYPDANGKLYRTTNNDMAIGLIRLKKSSFTFEGKKVMFFGDSITYNEDMYVAILLERTGMVRVANFALNGARLANYSDSEMDGNPVEGDSHNNTVPNQVQKLLNNVSSYDVPDIVIVSAATNGGTFEAAYDESQYTDENDAYIDLDAVNLTKCSGAMRWIYEKLISCYPNAKIFFATPIQSYGGGSRTYAILSTKAECIRQNCERLSTPCIDAFRKSGIYGRYEASSANGKYLKDGLHPNSAGAVVLAKCYHRELANALID